MLNPGLDAGRLIAILVANKMNHRYPPISFGSQYGGKDAFAAVGPTITKLESLANSITTVPYGAIIQSLSFVFRVDGAIQQWNIFGCDNAQIDKKEKYASIDIGIPITKWKNVETTHVRGYIAQCLAEGAAILIDHLAMHNISFDAQRALAEIKTLQHLFNKV
jgi:hypothetical protein